MKQGKKTVKIAGSHLRILLVEDHSDTREAIKMWLERKGHTVFAIDTQKAAIEIGMKQLMDLLVCDVRLPDGEGWPLLKQLRSLSELNATLLGISMSCYGHSDAEMTAKSRESGYLAHLVKPCPAEDMAKALRKVEELKMGGTSASARKAARPKQTLRSKSAAQRTKAA